MMNEPHVHVVGERLRGVLDGVENPFVLTR
jgi:hypothetical protein